MANPYDIEFVRGFIGQQKTQRLEFKSSRELLNENSQKRSNFTANSVQR